MPNAPECCGALKGTGKMEGEMTLLVETRGKMKVDREQFREEEKNVSRFSRWETTSSR